MSRILLTLLLATPALGAEPVKERDDLLRRADRIRPNSGDLRWQQLPWLTDPAEALKQARSENRPLFVWLAGGRDRDGNPLERC